MVEDNNAGQDAKMSNKQFGLLLFLGAKKEEIKGLTMKQASAKIQELQKAHNLPVTEPKLRAVRPQVQVSKPQPLPPEPTPITRKEVDQLFIDARKEIIETLNQPEQAILNLNELHAKKFDALMQAQSQSYWLAMTKYEHMLKTGRINSVKANS